MKLSGNSSCLTWLRGGAHIDNIPIPVNSFVSSVDFFVPVPGVLFRLSLSGTDVVTGMFVDMRLFRTATSSPPLCSWLVSVGASSENTA